LAKAVGKKKPAKPWSRKRERCEFCGRLFYGYVITGPRTKGKEACPDCYEGLEEPRPVQSTLFL